MIKGCCFYCKYLNYPDQSPSGQCKACYNALGGQSYMGLCTAGGFCREKIAENHNCWEGQTMFAPQELGLPAKFQKWQGQQESIIEGIVRSNKDLYLLDAPTGSGKSVIGIASSTIWRTNWLITKRLSGEDDSRQFHLPKRVVYVTRTKQLQQQLLNDFPNSRMIKGRDNFPCLLAPNKFPDFTADDCPHAASGTQCPQKNSCPYLVAKSICLNADIAVLNQSYYLAETNGPGQFSGADFVILDEVDSIEGTLMNQISMYIPMTIIEEFGLQAPIHSDDWREWVGWWAKSNSPRMNLAQQVSNDMPQASLWNDEDIRKGKRIKRLKNFNENLATFMHETINPIIRKDLAANPPVVNVMPNLSDVTKIQQMVNTTDVPFVSCPNFSKKNKFLGWHLKPVSVQAFVEGRLWRHAERFLGMSGTILSPSVLVRELGYKDGDYEYRQIPSPFDLKKRPVYYCPIANMNKKNIDDGTAVPKMLDAVDKLLKKYANVKILIHTANYNLAEAIRKDQFETKHNKRIIWHDSEDRADQLDAFKTSPDPLVMLSPSFDRGVDLPDDLCRCIIIVKMPYLNLGDQQVAARVKAAGGDQWYVYKAIQTVMQMTGRGVRNEQDYCETWILDQQFTSLLGRTRQYIPKWWLDAIKRVEAV